MIAKKTSALRERCFASIVALVNYSTRLCPGIRLGASPLPRSRSRISSRISRSRGKRRRTSWVRSSYFSGVNSESFRNLTLASFCASWRSQPRCPFPKITRILSFGEPIRATMLW